MNIRTKKIKENMAEESFVICSAKYRIVEENEKEFMIKEKKIKVTTNKSCM